MPYIADKERPEIDEDAINLMAHINNAGQLNYAISQLCWMYLNLKGIRYTNINEVIGVMECAKQEFYARVARKYEDEKIKENGDVFI